MNFQTEMIYSNLGKKDLHLECPNDIYEFKEVKLIGKKNSIQVSTDKRKLSKMKKKSC